jgi:very-short-patch-repair endonuclease
MGSTIAPSDDNFDAAIAALAATTHGVFTRDQAMKLGATKAMIARRLKVGRWETVHPAVYRLAGAPPTWQQKTLAACYAVGGGAALSHSAAGAIRGFPVKGRGVVLTASREARGRRVDGVKVYLRARPIPARDVTTIYAIPVTKSARTLLDLAATESEEVVEACLDHALRRRLVSIRFLTYWLADPELGRHGGKRTLSRLLRLRAGSGPTDSYLETQLVRLARERRLPKLVLQHQVWDGERFIGRVDFAYPKEKIAIEMEGFDPHFGRKPFDEDRARSNDLQDIGWIVIQVTATHLAQDPDAVERWIRNALAARRAERI